MRQPDCRFGGRASTWQGIRTFPLRQTVLKTVWGSCGSIYQSGGWVNFGERYRPNPTDSCVGCRSDVCRGASSESKMKTLAQMCSKARPTTLRGSNPAGWLVHAARLAKGVRRLAMSLACCTVASMAFAQAKPVQPTAADRSWIAAKLYDSIHRDLSVGLRRVELSGDSETEPCASQSTTRRWSQRLVRPRRFRPVGTA